MAISLYIDRPSPLQRRHPLTKLMAMIGFFFAAFLTDRPHFLLPLTLLIATLILWSHAAANVRRLRTLFLMVPTMAFVVWALFYEGGQPWLHLGPLTLSREGLELAAAMAIKLVTFLAIGTLFLSTTTIEEFSHALIQIGVPYRFGFTITLAFRLVPVFVDSAITVVQAQRSRGFDFERGNLIERVRRYVPVIVPVFIGALRRADGMAMALEARGFQRRTPRTSFRRYRMTWGDGLALATTLAIATVYLMIWQAGWSSLSSPF